MWYSKCDWNRTECPESDLPCTHVQFRTRRVLHLRCDARQQPWCDQTTDGTDRRPARQPRRRAFGSSRSTSRYARHARTPDRKCPRPAPVSAGVLAAALRSARLSRSAASQRPDSLRTPRVPTNRAVACGQPCVRRAAPHVGTRASVLDTSSRAVARAVVPARVKYRPHSPPGGCAPNKPARAVQDVVPCVGVHARSDEWQPKRRPWACAHGALARAAGVGAACLHGKDRACTKG